jgi:Homeodomain-like domain
MRQEREVDEVLELSRGGLTTSEIARRAGIPRSTVRDWLRHGPPRRRPHACETHDPSLLDKSAYAYLLGIYLGDGCISAYPRGVWRLRITLDAVYPDIVAECARAVEAVAPGRAGIYRRPRSRVSEVSNYWKHWPCLIPQHGPGRKHTRPITLADWQQRIVSTHAEQFLRGLIQSDGTRIIATERKGSYVRRAPRYAFSNRSEDILELFRTACETAGVHCTRASVTQIAVYSKAAVARLDEFVGPKR